MPFLLIPVAAVGYKMWENRQKQKTDGVQRDDENGEASRVVDTLPSDVADKLEMQEGGFDKDNTDDTFVLDNMDSTLSTDDDDQTRSTMNDEQGTGALFGIRKFIVDKIDERRERDIQKQKNRELAIRIARGEVPAVMPKISYK